MMQARPAYPLKVFYDGSCYVCSTEMDVYRNKKTEGRLVFIDISGPGFNPAEFGLTMDDFMARMHAIDADGAVYEGVDAFPAIWGASPGNTMYALLARLVTLPVVNTAARAGYAVFARLRKYLPRKRHACRAGVCGSVKR